MSKRSLLKILVIFLLSVLFIGCSRLNQKQQAQKAKPLSAMQVLAPAPAPIPKNSSHINKFENRDTLYKLYYGTNRKPIDINDYSKGYTNQRADRLYTGNCRIFIPASHKIGEVDGSLWEKIIHLDMSYGEIKVKSIKRYKQNSELWEKLRKEFKYLKNKEALIFIHGYNNTFESSAIRAGQIGYDLKFKGIMAFYSWPSVGTKSGYPIDEATIQASEKYIKGFLVDFVKKSNATKVNIIAHSMGNRGLIRVINDIQKENQNIRFGQIILAAPDVDADLFKNIAKAYTEISDKTTLYVSSNDNAVKLSAMAHQNPRAGLVKPVTVVDNIDTVNVNIDFTNLFSKFINLNHTYFAKEKRILEDIKTLLEKKTHSNIGKVKKNRNSKPYWYVDID